MKYCMQFILLNKTIMKACIRIHFINLINFIQTNFEFNCRDCRQSKHFHQGSQKNNL